MDNGEHVPTWNDGTLWNSGAVWADSAAPVVPTPSKPMANETRQLPPATLADDKAAVAACKKITTYTPQKAEFNQTALDASETALKPLEDDFTQKKTAFEGARDDLVTAQWHRHNLVLGMRGQIKSQFGENSNEVQSVGLKKKSEYKKGGRRKTAPPPA